MRNVLVWPCCPDKKSNAARRDNNAHLVQQKVAVAAVERSCHGLNNSRHKPRKHTAAVDSGDHVRERLLEHLADEEATYFRPKCGAEENSS